MTRNDFSSWYRVEVRWADMDSMGHVNNAVYFTYMESARVKFLESLGLMSVKPEENEGLGLVSATCNFRQEVAYPAVLDAGTRVTKIGNTSFHLETAFFPEGAETPAAHGSVVIVWVNYARGKAIPLPGVLREALESRLA